MNPLGKEIGQRIRDARLRQGLTQEELAHLIDMERPNVSRLERGLHVPSLETVYAVSSALRTSVAALLPASAPR